MTYKCLLFFCITIVAVNAASVHLKLFKNPSRVQERFILKLVSGKEANKGVNKAKFVESSLEKVDKVREVINAGIRDLKTDADEYSKKHGVKKVDETRWKALTESIDKRVNLLKKSILTKDSSNPDNIWEIFLVDFEITFGAFVQNVTEDFQTVDGNKENEKPVLVLFIQAGIGSLLQELQETINPYEETNPSPDVPDVPIQMPKTVLTLISSFIQGQSGASQNDAPTSQRPIQALAESIGQAVSNLNPFRTTTSAPSTTQSASSPSVANDFSTQPPALVSSNENVKVDNVANNQSTSPLNVVIHVVYDKPSLDALTTQPQPTQSSSNTVVEPRLPEVISGENAPQEKFSQQLTISPESSSNKGTSVAELENKHISQGDTFNIIIDLSSVTSNLAQNNLNSIKKQNGEADKKNEPLKEDLVQNVASSTETIREGQFESEKLSSTVDSLLSSLPSSPSSSPENVILTTETFVQSLASSTVEPLSSSNEENENGLLTDARNKPATTIKSEEFPTEEIKPSSEPISSSIAEVVPSSPAPPDSTTTEQIQTTLSLDESSQDDKSSIQEETKSDDQNIQSQRLQEENAQPATPEVLTSTENLEDVNISDETYNCRFANPGKKEQLKRLTNQGRNTVKKLKRKGTSR